MYVGHQQLGSAQSIAAAAISEGEPGTNRLESDKHPVLALVINNTELVHLERLGNVSTAAGELIKRGSLCAEQ